MALFYGIFLGVPTAKIFYFPLVLAPLLMLTLGATWALASLGVYLRDVSQIVAAVIPALMFLSPVFFPLTALPAEYHSIVELNPLTFLIEETRSVLIWGKNLEWDAWMRQSLISILVAWLGYVWFQKTRKGFSDVL